MEYHTRIAERERAQKFSVFQIQYGEIMKQAFSKNKWLWLTSAVFAAAAATLQTVAILTVYEHDTNYFKPTAILPLLALACAIIAALIGTVAALRTDAGDTGIPFPYLPIPAPTAIGFAAAAVAIACTKHTMTNKLVVPLTAVALGIAALYSVLVQFPALRRRRVLVTLTGFVAIISCILINAYYYFDVSVEMNAPLKTVTQTALLFLMLYLTSEVRYLLDAAQPRTYLTLASWTVAFCSLAAIPLPVAFLTGRLDRLDYAAGGLLALCACAMILIRFNCVLRPRTGSTASAKPEETATSDVDAEAEVTPDEAERPTNSDTTAIPNESDREDQI